jgi:hypothetical protein
MQPFNHVFMRRVSSSVRRGRIRQWPVQFAALLALVADRVGQAGGLCDALAGTRERRSAHDPGRVFCDLAVMLADGGRSVSDLAALAGQADLVNPGRWLLPDHGNRHELPALLAPPLRERLGGG